MKKIRIKHEKTFLAFLIILLIILCLCYANIAYSYYSREQFFKSSLRIANQNQNSVFRISKIFLYSSANAIDNSENQSLQNLDICQYTDISITVDNTSYIQDLTTTNTVQKLYIDNINIKTNSSSGLQSLNYKNFNNFATFQDISNPTDGTINFNIINTNEQNDQADYNLPTFYADCSNPITLGYLNKGIVKGFSVNNEVNSLVFNGKLLQSANVNLDDIGFTLTFDIHIINYDNDSFVYHASVDGNLNNENNGIYNGYLYQGKNNTSGSEYDFFKEVDAQ